MSYENYQTLSFGYNNQNGLFLDVSRPITIASRSVQKTLCDHRKQWDYVRIKIVASGKSFRATPALLDMIAELIIREHKIYQRCEVYDKIGDEWVTIANKALEVDDWMRKRLPSANMERDE